MAVAFRPAASSLPYGAYIMFNTDQLHAIADQPGLWTSNDGMFPTLRTALARTAHISAQGRTPYKLRGPGNAEVDHAQMLELWGRLGIVRTSNNT